MLFDDQDDSGVEFTAKEEAIALKLWRSFPPIPVCLHWDDEKNQAKYLRAARAVMRDIELKDRP